MSTPLLKAGTISMAIRLKLLMPPKSVFTISGLAVWAHHLLPWTSSRVFWSPKMWLCTLVVGSLVFSLIQICSMLPCLNIVHDGRHTVKVLVYLSAWNMRACFATDFRCNKSYKNAPSTNPGWSLSPLKLGKQTAVDSGCVWISCCPTLDPPFYTIMKGSSGTEFYTNIIVSPQDVSFVSVSFSHRAPSLGNWYWLQRSFPVPFERRKPCTGKGNQKSAVESCVHCALARGCCRVSKSASLTKWPWYLADPGCIWQKKGPSQQNYYCRMNGPTSKEHFFQSK